MIYYIYHSAFAIELEKNILIFDFYKIPKGRNEEEFINKFIKRNDKRVIVFSTHSHSDHFNKKILDWTQYNENIIYILSDDIKIPYKSEKFYFTREDDKLEIELEKGNNIAIYTFGSTDLGSSFFINIENKNIFHAGDLHFWHWEDDTELEEKEMKEAYITQLKKVQKLEKIDIAFVVVDPRLGENVYEGVDIFWEMLKPKTLIPMHFGDDYSAMKGFIERFKDKGVQTIEIKEAMASIK